MTNFEKYSDPKESWNAYMQQTNGHIITHPNKVLDDGSVISSYRQEAGYAFWLMCNSKRFIQEGL